MFRNRSGEESVILENIASLGIAFAQAWQRILIADALFMNTDRHLRNFGVIRSASTGEILRLAPNFDNNQAYKANLSRRYSGVLLRGLLSENDRAIREPLAQLLDACRKRAYLQDAVLEGEKYI